jgi:hypothetical protein
MSLKPFGHLCAAALLLVGSMAASGRAAEQLPQSERLGLEDVLPARTILFIQLVDLSRLAENLEGTSLGRVSKHPEVREFLNTLAEAYAHVVDVVTEKTGARREAVEALFTTQFSFAFRGFDTEGNSLNYYALRFAETPQRDALYELLQSIMHRFADPRIPIGTEDVAGVTVLRGPLPDVHYMALLEDLLVITPDREGLVKAIERYRNPDGTTCLADYNVFRRIHEGCGAQTSGSFYYLNTQLAMPVLMGLTTPEVAEVFRAIGLPSVEGIGASAITSKEGIRDTLYLYAPGERTGILRVASLGEEGAEAGAQLVAGDAGAMISARAKLVQLYRELPRLIDALQAAWPLLTGGNAGTVEEGAVLLPGLRALVGHEDLLGVPIEDFIRPLGPAIVVMPSPAGVAARFDEADPAAFEEVIRRLERKMAQSELFANASLTSLAEQGKVLRYFNQSGYPVPLAPSYVVLDEDTILFGTHPQVLKALLRMPEIAPIAETRDFNRVMEGMPREMHGLMYVDSTASYARVYDALIPFVNALTAYPSLRVDPGLLPPGDELTPVFFGTALSARNRRDGITFVSYSPLGLGGAFVYGLDHMVVNNPATMSAVGGFIMHYIHARFSPKETVSPAEPSPDPFLDGQ